MGKKICENCEQTIGNLEESCLYKNHVVCKKCKILLEEPQAIEVVENDVGAESPIADTPSQDTAAPEHKPTTNLVQQNKQKKNYGGLHRTGYFFGMLGIATLQVIFNVVAPGNQEIVILGIIITLVPAFILVVNRLHNIGMSGWWSLLILLPIINLYIAFTCFMCQEGYKDTKKLDTAGKIIGGIIAGGMIIGMLIAMRGF